MIDGGCRVDTQDVDDRLQPKTPLKDVLTQHHLYPISICNKQNSFIKNNMITTKVFISFFFVERIYRIVTTIFVCHFKCASLSYILSCFVCVSSTIFFFKTLIENFSWGNITEFLSIILVEKHSCVKWYFSWNILQTLKFKVVFMRVTIFFSFYK